MKFIHTADIHLDSPLTGLAAYKDAPADLLRTVTRDAFTRLVDEAMDEAVDFMIIAGDLYDGSWKDYNTGHFFCREMGRLNKVGIPVYLLLGNHDADSEMTRKLTLPPNVHQFESRKANTFLIEKLRVALHGRSYREAATVENLSAGYPARIAGWINIGVLHTALEGYAEHACYAPCSLAELSAKGYDYWALGHVHEHAILQNDPWVVFPGNLQGRHIRETGARGAIVRSDRLRSLTSEIDQAVKRLLHVGDGLDRKALESGFDAVNIDKIPIRLSEIKLQIDEVVSQQNQLSGELNSAEASLGKIAGQDQAARAESRRQEALAGMSNAAERYIKVYTSAKLLRWSIERFRESKQGPMLTRASEVFCGLTLGIFNRLVVDYDSEPLKLSGQRASGELVAVDGMSEGTRDQLYLALSLAALELRLAQTPALPFIADDLFINYDDGRARAGLDALSGLSEMTQVIFLSHHDHLVPMAQSVFGDRLNVVELV